LLNGTPLTTRYSYDVLGRLTGIVDPIGASWSYVYDTLSRRIVSYDPDLGTWIYQYDYSGNLIGQRDALGQATQNSYDALDRIITSVTRAGTGQADTTNYLYDQARAGTANYGHLTTTSNAALTIQHDYDIAGREFRTSYLTPGGSLSASVTSTFDVGGRVIGLSYGDGDQIGSPSQPWTYDLYARLYTMPGAITAQTYIAAGATASITYANGAATQFAYSPLRLWLTGLTTTSGGSTLQQLAYGRDASGRITQIQATGGPSDDGWTYAYDGVGPPTLELSPHHERGVGSLSLAPSC